MRNADRLSQVLLECVEAAENPAARIAFYLDAGMRGVACLHMYCPTELVTAAGMLPVVVHGSHQVQANEAKRFFPVFYCGIAQTILEMGLRGSLDRFAAVIAPLLCDSMKCLSQNFAAGVPGVPLIPLPLPHNRETTAAREYLLAVLADLRARIGDLAGAPIDDESLTQAIGQHNAQRQLMREFADMAGEYPHLVSPRERSGVFQSANFIPVAEHTQMLREIVSLLSEETPRRDRPRIVLTGIVADNPDFLAALDECGLCVVGDDVGHESRLYRTDTEKRESPLASLADRFLSLRGCSTLSGSPASRAGIIKSLVTKQRADGVVLLLTKFCDPEDYDHPLLRRQLEDAGIPLLTIDEDRQMRDFAKARIALETFREIL